MMAINAKRVIAAITVCILVTGIANANVNKGDCKGLDEKMATALESIMSAYNSDDLAEMRARVGTAIDALKEPFDMAKKCGCSKSTGSQNDSRVHLEAALVKRTIEDARAAVKDAAVAWHKGYAEAQECTLNEYVEEVGS